MDLKSVSEAGLSAVVEGLTKVRESIPEEALELADQAKESPFAKQVLELASTAAAQSEEARERAAEAVAVAKDRSAEATAAARERAAEAVAAAKERAAAADLEQAEVPTDQSGHGWVKVAIGTVVAAAVAGAGYAFLRRRGATEEEPAEPAEPFESGVAAEQSPDATDEQFAEAVDKAADELAEEIAEAVEGVEPPEEQGEADAEQGEPAAAEDAEQPAEGGDGEHHEEHQQQ